MKKGILFGYGTIGRELVSQLPKDKVSIEYIVRFTGVFNSSLEKVGEQSEWRNFADGVDVVFIAVPSIARGEVAFEYEKFFLENNIPVITCEKASVAHNFDYLKSYKNIFKYTASVGGGTRMLNEISKFKPEEIIEIKGVVNGTLNYIGDGIKNGKDKDQIIKEVLEKGYAEPGFTEFDDIIKSELSDVLFKSVIIANCSGIFDRTISIDDIKLHSKFNENKRCVVRISREKIDAGFIEDTNASWLPDVVNNSLEINGGVVCMGPGAGAKATVESMIFDFESLF